MTSRIVFLRKTKTLHEFPAVNLRLIWSIPYHSAPFKEEMFTTLRLYTSLLYGVNSPKLR